MAIAYYHGIIKNYKFSEFPGVWPFEFQLLRVPLFQFVQIQHYRSHWALEVLRQPDPRSDHSDWDESEGHWVCHLYYRCYCKRISNLRGCNTHVKLENASILQQYDKIAVIIIAVNPKQCMKTWAGCQKSRSYTYFSYSLQQGWGCIAQSYEELLIKTRAN